MTLVVGTAGHIDHGKTTLLRALTGIDADRLPEERRRGMTIDVGYAHLRLADGAIVDFVDVPGHDRLIGNMLVGAGEIDAALLVVAADDGPRAQTLEHLELLDALGIADGFVAVTKADAVPAERAAEIVASVRELIAGTSLAAFPIVTVSAATGTGLEALRATLADVQRRFAARRAGASDGVGPPRLAVDRVFSVRGRGIVVTGSLRGGGIARGDTLRAEPIGGEFRVRDLQVHNGQIDRVDDGGRVALNLAAAGGVLESLRRGVVLTAGPGVERGDRLLLSLWPRPSAALRHGMHVRVHAGTATADGTLDLSRRASVVDVSGRRMAIVRLAAPIAAAIGDAVVLRRPSPGGTLAGGVVFDPMPPHGVARRRMAAGALLALLETSVGSTAQIPALIRLHGAVPRPRIDAWSAIVGGRHGPTALDADIGVHVGPVMLAADVAVALDDLALATVDAPRDPGQQASLAGRTVTELRAVLAGELRRRASLDEGAHEAVADALVDRLVASSRLRRIGDRVAAPSADTVPAPALAAAMDRLVHLLATTMPPPLREAAASAHCPSDAIRLLESAGRIVRVEDDLAWETATLRRLEAVAVGLAARGPVPPATFRDAIGASRRYALAILEDLGRRGVLQRTPEGHVLGPRGVATTRPSAAASVPTSSSR